MSRRCSLLEAGIFSQLVLESLRYFVEAVELVGQLSVLYVGVTQFVQSIRLASRPSLQGEGGASALIPYFEMVIREVAQLIPVVEVLDIPVLVHPLYDPLIVDLSFERVGHFLPPTRS